MKTIYLLPGEWSCSKGPALIDTILGSCLGIVMRRPGGATCVAHCVLPRGTGEPGAQAGEARFVDRWLERTIAFFDHQGSDRGEIDVKLFGGSQLLPAAPASRSPSVGRQNLESALGILRREGFRVSEQDVGGHRGRRIVVNSVTGEVQVRYITPSVTHSPAKAAA